MGKKSRRISCISKMALILVVAIFLQTLFITDKVDGVVTSDLTCTIINSTQISLNWTDNLVNEKGYTLERKVDSGAFEFRQMNTPNITNCIDTVEEGHTYTYRVKATDSTDITYIYTNDLTFRPNDIRIPDSLMVTPISHTQIDLKWTYPELMTYNTIIERKAEDETSWRQIATVGIGQNTFSDKTIASGKKYYYKVRAYSNEKIRTVAYPDENIGIGTFSLLYKPTNVYGYAISQYLVQLKWQDNSFETAFIIERRTPDDGVFKEIAVVPQNTTTYIDNVPNENALYTYRIKAVTGSTASEYSDLANITSTYLRTPAALSATCIDGKNVTLSWQDATSNETGFEIWRKTAADTEWSLYDIMGRNATSYIDMDVLPQTDYFYKVRSKINDNSVYSNFTNDVEVWTSTISPPGNLDCKVISSSEIDLTWEDTSTIEAGFIVERRTSLSTGWYQISQLSPNQTNFIDKDVNSNYIYYYRIKAYDQSNAVGYSNVATITMKTPEAPSQLKIKALSSNDLILSWKDNSSFENGFVIEAKQVYTFKEIGRVGSDATAFIYKSASPDKTVTYRVRAIYGNVLSNSSNEVSITTPNKVTYIDLSSVSWAVDAINNLASRNVFNARPNSKFYPNQAITRGEYCAIIVRSLGLEDTAAGRFADVTVKHKYYSELMTAAKYGIINSDKNNKIYPDKLITREQAGIMLALALKAKETPLPERDSNVLKQFADYRSISEISAGNIAAVCGAGIITGRKTNGKIYLQLSNGVTRAEAALIVYKGLNYVG